MTSITSSITSKWTTAYGAAFITTDSDGAAETEYLVFTPTPYARADLEELWSTARAVEDTALQLYRDTHPKPETYYYASPWTKETWGEQRIFSEQLKAANDSYWSQLKAAAANTHKAAYTALPLVRANITDAALNLWPPEASGGSGQDEPIAGPLAVIAARSYAPYADFALPSDLTPRAHLATIDDRVFVAYDNSDGTPPDFVADPEALERVFATAAEAADQVFAERARCQELTSWAQDLTPDQIDTLDFEHYRLFERFRPKEASTSPLCTHTVTRPRPLPKNPRYGTTGWGVRAHATFQRSLHKSGLYEITFGDDPTTLYKEVPK